jgi:hypothetical protein
MIERGAAAKRIQGGVEVDEVLDRIAAALGVAPLTDAEQQLLLDCARDVAHGSARRHAPLSTFLLGAAIGAGEVDRETALRAAVSRVTAVAGEVDIPPDPPAS